MLELLLRYLCIKIMGTAKMTLFKTVGTVGRYESPNLNLEGRKVPNLAGIIACRVTRCIYLHMKG